MSFVLYSKPCSCSRILNHGLCLRFFFTLNTKLLELCDTFVVSSPEEKELMLNDADNDDLPRRMTLK